MGLIECLFRKIPKDIKDKHMDQNKNIKDNNSLTDNARNLLLQSVFVRDNDLEYIFKKTEKISTAVYLITNFFSPEEPLKWDIRNIATKLLRFALSFSQGSLYNKEKRTLDLNGAILELSSLFDLAYRSGFVTVMNYQILNTEINRLGTLLMEYNAVKLGSNKPLFTDESFAVSRTQSQPENVAGQRNTYGTTYGTSYTKPSFIKDISKGQTKRPNVLYTNANSKRRETIINEVKRLGEVSVKDISIVVTDCSEKTLQRELLAMVDAGILSKTGERRWSRYSIRK